MEKEILLSDFNIPLEINLTRIGDIYTTWSKEIKIIYVLKGRLTVDINQNEIILEENQFILINSYDFLSVSPKIGEEVLILEFLIDGSGINRFYQDFSQVKFSCCSTNANIDFSKYRAIRLFFTKILDILFKNSFEKNMLILNYLIELVVFLLHNFRSGESTFEKDSSNRSRLIKIFDYLDRNYDDENLGIYDVASYVNLSPQHLLKIFRTNLGITMADYLNTLRIKKSLNDLLYSEKNIIELAMENGFNNSKSYHRIFKKIYNMTPGDYKKKYKLNLNIEEINEIFPDRLEILEQFRNFDFSNEEIKYDGEIETSIVDVNLNKIKKIKFKHYWKKTMSFGKAFEGLRGDIQAQIKEIKEELNPEYVRFMGLFSDEMHIYNEDAHGNIYYNYSYIDKLLDFLISLNLKPYINIGFMPKKLAEKEQYVFASSINVSYPRDIKKWNDLVKNIINHFIEKYGEKEVFTWYFEIWNNPNLKNMYWYDSDEKFHLFFLETFNSIKSISPKLIVGGPSAVFNMNKEWIVKFLEFINSKNVKLDFLSFTGYHMNESPDPFFELHESNKELDNISLIEFSTEIKKRYMKKIELVISEWNLTTSSYNLYNDNCYKAVYIIDTLLKNINPVNQIIYWTSTENKVRGDILYGGLGLFTTNNLKKASYNAFLLLNKLGDTLISKGDNYVITSKGESMQVMLYNYANESSASTLTKEILMNINYFNQGKYRITKYYLNAQSGSIYEAWNEIGSPEKITEEVFELLKAKEKMDMKIETREIFDNLNIKEQLEINQVILLDIKKIYEHRV